MRILQIIPDLELAGAERMLEALTRSLVDLDNDVEVVSLYSKETPIVSELRAAGVRVHMLEKRSGLDLRVVPSLRHIVKDFKPEVIHTHRYAPLYASAAVAGVRCRWVHTVHSVAANEIPNRQKPLHKALIKSGKMLPVALTKTIQSTVCKVYGVDTSKVPVVLNGVDLSRFPFHAHTRELGEKKPFEVLTIGRNEKAKNQQALIEGFAIFHKQFPKSHLRIVGAGSLRAQLEDTVRAMGLQGAVSLCEPVSDVSQLYAGSSVFVLPSVYEGMPMSLVEAMSSGIPIIATWVGGVPDMLTAHTALRCGIDSDSIGDALVSVCSDYQSALLRADRAQQASRRFGSEAMAKRYLELYRSVAKEGILE